MSKAEELIACLEGEIAKRDETIARLEPQLNRAIQANYDLREELAACRVAVENCDLFRARIAELEARIVWLECEAQVNAAPVSDAKAQEPDCDRGACGDFSPGPCDNPDCSARRDRTVVAPAAKAQGVVMPERWNVPRPMWKDARQPYGNPLNHADIEAAEKFNLALDEVARLNAAPAAPAADAGALADAFLSWKLPESVRPDGCAMDPTYPHRYGTNLMTWAQAKEMFEYVLAAHSAKGVQ